jgi:hypothetical protein
LPFTPPIDLPIPSIAEESSIAAGEGGVWIVSTDHRLVRVDPVTDRADPDPWPLPEGAAAARAGLGAIWITVPPTDSLLRLAPADPAASPQAIKVGHGPRFLAIGEDAVWVMDQAAGTVTRVDEPQQVIVLENGQMYRVSSGGTVYVDGRPTAFSTVRPGSRVTIVNGTPVVYREGQYVVVQPSSSSGAVAPGGVLTSQPTAVVTPGPPSTAVATAPAGAVVTAPATMRMTGRIVDVDRNEVKVKLDNGKSFEFRPPAGMVFRKGDPITIDMTIAGSPSALPR